jgi:HAD superfamily hydrolase (TIGR01509 family)
MCDVVVYSHEEGLKKPDRRFYEIACKRLDVAPQQAVFLDDSPACIGGAQCVGMTAITFLDTEQAIADLDVALK